MAPDTLVATRVQYSLARDPLQVEAAITLVSHQYRLQGYITDDDDAQSAISNFLRITDSVRTFLAHRANSLAGTVSVVHDSPAGLPMDLLYKKELDPLRESGSRIAEVCQFAVDATVLSETVAGEHGGGLDVSMRLLSCAVHHAINSGLTHLCFTINPKHRVFYESMGCIQVGGERSYSSVNGAPALAYALDVVAVKQSLETGGKQNMLLKKILSDFPLQHETTD